MTPADFFEGCPTILTSEKAALQCARNIYISLKKSNKKMWVDPDFGPKDANDLTGSASSLYKDGSVPKNNKILPEPKDVEWTFT